MYTEEKHLLQRNSMVWLCALICTALWGSAFPCIKVGYTMFGITSTDTASQMLFAGVRFFCAGILTILMGSIGQRRFLKPKAASIPKILTLCMFQTVIQYVLFYIGLAHTTGVKGSILGGITPIFSILLACLLFRQERFTGGKLIGCIAGLAGIILVNLNGSAMSMEFSLTGEGFMILSSLSSAFSAVFLKIFSNGKKGEDPVVLSGYQFFTGGLIMILISLLAGGRLSGFTPASAILLLYMAFISAAAYTLWGMLLKYNPVSKITIFGFMIQVFGVLLSTLILREGNSFGLQTLLALVLVCVGILLVSKKSKTSN